MAFDNDDSMQQYVTANKQIHKIRKSKKPYDPLEGTKFKVVVVGDQEVGKSWLINRFIKGEEFDPENDINPKRSPNKRPPRGEQGSKIQQYIKKVKVKMVN